jgi:RNA polymerase sigma-70 factor (ECF subfamily)
MLGNQEDAEDATQEAFLRAFHAMGRFDPSRPFKPWIKKITANLCLNLLEKKLDLAWDPDWLPPTEEPEGFPEKQSELRDQSSRIREALLKLPPRYRAAIELRHFQGLSYAEMAETLGCPLSQVKSDLYRARQRLIHLMSSTLHV